MKDEIKFEGWDPEAVPDKRMRLILDNRGNRFSLTVNPWILILLVLLLLGGLLYLGLYGFRAPAPDNSAALKQLEQENRLLRETLNKYSAELDSIAARLDTLKVQPVPEDEAYPYYGENPAGRGGARLDPQLDNQLGSFETTLARLKLRLGFDLSYAIPQFDLPAGFLRRGDGIPSIYPTFGVPSDGWGLRIHPVTQEMEFHTGLDIANRTGTPVYATADGVVAKAHTDPGFGKMITIAHASGYMTLYGHLFSIKVRPGDAVHKGQIIGLMGNTGLSTGPHLHYGVFRDREPVNPNSYLNRIDSGAYTGL